MSVDPNAYICHYCGLVNAYEGNFDVNRHVHPHWVRSNKLSTYETFYHDAWWNLQGYRGLAGLACPDCMTKIDDMSEQEIEAILTSQRVARRLEPE